MGLNDCDRIGRCEFDAGHTGPCSHEIKEMGGSEWFMAVWDGLSTTRNDEIEALRAAGWSRYSTCLMPAGSMYVFERPIKGYKRY